MSKPAGSIQAGSPKESLAQRSSVLFLDQSGSLGGAELMLLDLVLGLRRPGKVVVLQEGAFPERLRLAGVDTEVVPLGASASAVTKGATVSRSLRAGPAIWSCARRVATLASESDLIYANTQKALVVGALAARLAKKPLVFHLHDLVTASHFSRVNRRVMVTLVNHFAAAVVANSEASAAALRAAGGRPKRMAVVYNGFVEPGAGSDSGEREAAGSEGSDEHRAARGEGERESGERREGRNEGEKIDPSAADSVSHPPASPLARCSPLAARHFVVGLFGRITPWKGQATAIEALRAGPLAGVRVRLLVVGEALYTEEDRAYGDQLREAVEAGGLAERVEFLGQRDDVPALMSACDVIVHTSTQPEPFGRVIVEGMLAGKPVIATDGGGVREIVEDGVNGLLVPPGDAEALAKALARLRDEPGLAERLAAAGQAMARERFTVEKMVQGVQEVVDAVVREHKARARPRRRD